MIDNTEIGEIAGVVSTTTMALDDCAVNGAVVYIYEGSDAAADDLGSTVEPITSANVNYDADLNEYDYLASFIAPGNYTAALTCQAANDAPETDDDIAFLAQNNVLVEANTTTESSFN